MDPRNALLAAIRDNVDEDLPRLAYADWLEENGEADLAEFIRVECRLAGMPDDHPERRRLFRRDLELLADYKDEWVGPVRRGCAFWEVRRGFLDEINTSADNLLDHAAAIARHPLRVARLSVTEADLDALAGCPHLAGLRELALTGPQGLGDEAARAVAHSACLDRLESLALDGMLIGTAGAFALAAAPLGRLRKLRLRGGQIGPDGVEALVESPYLASLETLDLSGRYVSTPSGAPGQSTSGAAPNIGDAGVVRLARCPGSEKLRVLVLVMNHLGDEGVRALAESPYLAGLQALHLEQGPPASVAAHAALTARFGAVMRGSWVG
jgi:uncharacterized protein (TIGR02996 family)